MDIPILYILMRSDMASMNAGKGMAQASHAANAFVKKAKYWGLDITEWEESTSQGFGTVIVLDGGTIKNIENKLDLLAMFSSNDIVSDLIVDPTYPILDGSVVHHIEIPTCAYVYVHNRYRDQVKYILSDLKLHA